MFSPKHKQEIKKLLRRYTSILPLPTARKTPLLSAFSPATRLLLSARRVRIHPDSLTLLSVVLLQPPTLTAQPPEVDLRDPRPLQIKEQVLRWQQTMPIISIAQVNCQVPVRPEIHLTSSCFRASRATLASVSTRLLPSRPSISSILSSCISQERNPDSREAQPLMIQIR